MSNPYDFEGYIGQKKQDDMSQQAMEQMGTLGFRVLKNFYVVPFLLTLPLTLVGAVLFMVTYLFEKMRQPLVLKRRTLRSKKAPFNIFLILLNVVIWPISFVYFFFALLGLLFIMPYSLLLRKKMQR